MVKSLHRKPRHTRRRGVKKGVVGGDPVNPYDKETKEYNIWEFQQKVNEQNTKSQRELHNASIERYGNLNKITDKPYRKLQSEYTKRNLLKFFHPNAFTKRDTAVYSIANNNTEKDPSQSTTTVYDNNGNIIPTGEGSLTTSVGGRKRTSTKSKKPKRKNNKTKRRLVKKPKM
jgi:hypothetical protein